MSGHELRVAPSAVRSIAIARELQPDVASLDIGPPGMDGPEHARAVAKLGQRRLVAVAGCSLPAARVPRPRPFDARLIKPVNLRTLQNIVLELDHLQTIDVRAVESIVDRRRRNK